jgi:NADPH:quinone reductase-like Zn-dependent oxidoreductase
VKAIGLNRAEVMVREGNYLWKPALPAQIGFEASGIVEAIGPGVDPAWLGERISCTPTFSPLHYGTYGEVAILPVDALARFPQRLSFEQGAALWTAYLTAWGGLVHFASVRSGDAVLITAASSSTGLAAIDVVKAQGGTSIAVTRTGAKRQRLLDYGADYVIVSDDEDIVSRVQAVTSGVGARVVYDPVGGPGLRTLIAATAKGGTVIAYGLLSPDETVFPLFDALLKYISLKAYDVHEIYETRELLTAAKDYVVRQIEEGAITPRIDTTFPLDSIAEAHRYIESGRQIGKIVVTV